MLAFKSGHHFAGLNRRPMTSKWANFGHPMQSGFGFGMKMPATMAAMNSNTLKQAPHQTTGATVDAAQNAAQEAHQHNQNVLNPIIQNATQNTPAVQMPMTPGNTKGANAAFLYDDYLNACKTGTFDSTTLHEVTRSPGSKPVDNTKAAEIILTSAGSTSDGFGKFESRLSGFGLNKYAAMPVDTQANVPPASPSDLSAQAPPPPAGGSQDGSIAAPVDPTTGQPVPGTTAVQPSPQLPQLPVDPAMTQQFDQLTDAVNADASDPTAGLARTVTASDRFNKRLLNFDIFFR